MRTRERCPDLHLRLAAPHPFQQDSIYPAGRMDFAAAAQSPLANRRIRALSELDHHCGRWHCEWGPPPPDSALLKGIAALAATITGQGDLSLTPSPRAGALGSAERRRPSAQTALGRQQNQS